MVWREEPLWERPELRVAAGHTLRPGGFDLTDRALEHVGALPGWRVLDVGSGLGATVDRLRSRYGVEAWGVEPSAVQIARSGRSDAVIQARGDCLPFAGESFDAVLCECVLSLLDDRKAGLAEFGRVLRPGGFLILSDFDAPGASSGDSCVARAEPLSLVQERLVAGGFSVRLVEDHTERLKELAARLVFAGGGTGTICGGTGRPRYYLMIAQKKGTDHDG
ncbi:DVU_1556 family methyltransferase [Salidesulfovibrio brasiliensis]|uniref:DVU_1556 family methyltransferase n=1 Tax=Salidesulfovibrio brasiliensis TaxID=221711 RepID=UPI0006CF2170|nr:class I SAM-dependent methyltransferase [Salidesulfovibrio brasiliensis]